MSYQNYSNNYKDIKCENVRDNWFKGEYMDYSFTAMVFEEPSKYGIEGGKVSKLCIKDGSGDWLVNYDRGWDVEPTESVIDDYKDVLNYLEGLDITKF